MPTRKFTGSQVRSTFLRYFEQQGHKILHSSSLVPQNDPTLLFTNAGMNQFKDVFLGIEKRDYRRATTSQKCVRAGGKHNDLENVGFTNRHHTFFEMLGNFSFGDYFKKEAIAYAWELVTSPEWFGIPKDKLFATIFKGEEGIARDDEAYQHWLDVGVAPDRIYEFGMKDNFWMMGDSGPCGPCSEIHYDMGPKASDAGHTDCTFGCDCGRYVELWNLVFMQFDKQPDGKLTLLPKPSIDTGAGLERVTAVLQDKISNYDTDLFRPLIQRAMELTVGSKGDAESAKAASAASMRIIADHSRAATFLISDGVVPSNEGRGYVLRKIMRRAITHGRLSGQTKPFLYAMVFAVRDLMQDAYPELKESADRVANVVLAEEKRFAHTLDIGLEKLEEEFALVRTVAKESERETHPSVHRSKPLVFPGKRAFRLYDTFGMPPDFMQDAARDQGIIFDQAGFDEAMEEQRRRAQASWRGSSKQTASPAYQRLAEGKDPYAGQGGVLTSAHEPYTLTFIGYNTLRHKTRVVAVFWADPETGVDIPRSGVAPGHLWRVVLEKTPFYSTAGGQVGDTGWLLSEDGNDIIADVVGSDMPVAGLRVLTIRPRQTIEPGRGIEAGGAVVAVVDADRRRATMRNHTGTHLLHAALREVLGKHVKQAGSLVDPSHLRFDFSHFASVGDEELQDIEDLANKEVLRNDRVEEIPDVPIDVAINEYKAMALFGEKYDDRVRVIRIGDFSTELCGGTHTAATGEIGLIKILKEGSVSSGVRRVEAVTGEGSLRHFRKDHALENAVSTLVRGGDDQSPAEALRQELERREEEVKKLRKELEQARMKSASSSVQSAAAENVREVKGVKVLATRADNLERPQLRTLIDNLRNKLGSGVVVLGSVSDGKVALIVGVTKDLTSRVQAGKVIAEIAKKVGGSGGGRPDMAEAGGKDPSALDSALSDSYRVVEGLLS
jgi:alanyl-tRNA synthetase